jgi:Flp pilus assembly pilin Flp
VNIRLELVSDRGAVHPPPGAQGRAAGDEPVAPVKQVGPIEQVDLIEQVGPADPIEPIVPIAPGSEIAFSTPSRRWAATRLRRLLDDERGAVTAEYAIVILAAVAFAGLLVAIMRSEEIRAMLVRLVENALGAGG